MSEEGKEDLQNIPKLEQPGFQEPSQIDMQPVQTAPQTDPAPAAAAAADPVKKKKRKLIILLSTLVPAGAIILAAILVLVLVVLPEMDRSSRYDTGMQAYEAGKYSTAVEAFAGLPAYKESDKYHELAAVYALKEDGKYTEAKAEFTRLGLGDMATECDYLMAQELEKYGKSKEAYEAYKALKDYKDSKARVTAIQDTEVSRLTTAIKAISIPASQQEFLDSVKMIEDAKKEAASIAAEMRVKATADSKVKEMLPAFQKLYFDEVLAGKTTSNATYISKFGMTSSTNWAKLKKLITQRFDTCPDVLANYHKVTAAIKGKPILFRYYAVEYNEATKAFDKEKLIDESNTQTANRTGEWVMPNMLKGTYKGESYDFRYLFPNGIYRATIVLEDTNEVIASVYFTIGVK